MKPLGNFETPTLRDLSIKIAVLQADLCEMIIDNIHGNRRNKLCEQIAEMQIVRCFFRNRNEKDLPDYLRKRYLIE